MKDLKWFTFFAIFAFIFSACDSSKSIHIGKTADEDNVSGNDSDNGNDGETAEDNDSILNDETVNDSGDTGDDGVSPDSSDTGDTANDDVTGDDDIVIPPDCEKDEECSVLDGECVKGVCNGGECEIGRASCRERV